MVEACSLIFGAVGNLHNDFVEFVFNGFGVEFLDRRCDRYINIVIGILDFDTFEFLLFRCESASTPTTVSQISLTLIC